MIVFKDANVVTPVDAGGHAGGVAGTAVAAAVAAAPICVPDTTLAADAANLFVVVVAVVSCDIFSRC